MNPISNHHVLIVQLNSFIGRLNVAWISDTLTTRIEWLDAKVRISLFSEGCEPFE
jgi:hypothetical protein